MKLLSCAVLIIGQTALVICVKFAANAASISGESTFCSACHDMEYGIQNYSN
jgi:nitrate/TMAO reductase-like tetraheme cytochrome c subunit